MTEMCSSFWSTNGSPSSSTILCGCGHNRCRLLWVTSGLTGVLMCVRTRFSIAYSCKAIVNINPQTQRWIFWYSALNQLTPLYHTQHYRHHILQLHTSLGQLNQPTSLKGYLTLSWPAGHIYPTYKESFLVSWDNSIPLFLHAAIYLEVTLFCWTSQNAFSRKTAVYKWYWVQCCTAALHTVSFVHGCFMGKWILTSSPE